MDTLEFPVSGRDYAEILNDALDKWRQFRGMPELDALPPSASVVVSYSQEESWQDAGYRGVVQDAGYRGVVYVKMMPSERPR